MRHLALGASLYVPATRSDLVAIANGERIPGLRSVIFCTEDAVRPEDVGAAVANLEAALCLFRPARLLRFVRVRNPHVLGRVLAAPGAAQLDGFVIPKATQHNLPAYLEQLGEHDPYLLMPTLETAEVFDLQEMRALRQLLLRDEVRARILSLRIGGNDLLNLLQVRRSCGRTIYETPVGAAIAMLAGTFRPYGFNLTAPVFEGLAHPEVLRREVELDLQHGLFGKTAVHPDQIQVIESLYAVTAEELQFAERVLARDAPAVFRLHNRMGEEATHASWARAVHERHRVYGLAPAAVGAALAPALPGSGPGAEVRPRLPS